MCRLQYFLTKKLHRKILVLKYDTSLCNGSRLVSNTGFSWRHQPKQYFALATTSNCHRAIPTNEYAIFRIYSQLYACCFFLGHQLCLKKILKKLIWNWPNIFRNQIKCKIFYVFRNLSLVLFCIARLCTYMQSIFCHRKYPNHQWLLEHVARIQISHHLFVRRCS